MIFKSGKQYIKSITACYHNKCIPFREKTIPKESMQLNMKFKVPVKILFAKNLNAYKPLYIYKPANNSTFFTPHYEIFLALPFGIHIVGIAGREIIVSYEYMEERKYAAVYPLSPNEKMEMFMGLI